MHFFLNVFNFIFTPLHVSSSKCSSSGGSVCIYTPSGTTYSSGWLSDEHLLLETCRGVEINTLRKSASIWPLTRIKDVLIRTLTPSKSLTTNNINVLLSCLTWYKLCNWNTVTNKYAETYCFVYTFLSHTLLRQLLGWVHALDMTATFCSIERTLLRYLLFLQEFRFCNVLAPDVLNVNLV